MKNIVLNKNKINHLQHLCTGSEAIIYREQKHIYKIFNNNTNNKMKEKKLSLISKLEKPYLVTPSAMLYDKKTNFIGYQMPFIQQDSKHQDLLKMLFDESLTVADRIQIINYINNCIKDLNQHDIYIDDFNLRNFLLDEYQQLQFIDIDNFIVGKYDSDLKSFNNQALEHNTSSLARQRFCFMMFVMRFLANPYGQNMSLLNNKQHIIDELERFDFPESFKNKINQVIHNLEKPDINDDLHLLTDYENNYLHPVR